MNHDNNFLIFWEPAVLQNGGPAGVAAGFNYDLARYFGDIGGSGLYNILTQYGYYSHSGRFHGIHNSSHYGGYLLDTSPYPPGGCTTPETGANCVTDEQIQAEISKALTLEGWKPSLSSAFFVYTTGGEAICTDASFCSPGGFCGYHTNGSTRTQLIYDVVPYPAAPSAPGCEAAQGQQIFAPNGDVPTDAAIDTTSHEQIESVTDPYGDAWFGAGGVTDEIADKCGYRYGQRPYLDGTANQLLNDHYYILQMEWDNYRHGCRRADNG